MIEVTDENHLSLIRDMINDMEEHLCYKENRLLCDDRIANIMMAFVFNDELLVAGDVYYAAKKERKDKKTYIRNCVVRRYIH